MDGSRQKECVDAKRRSLFARASTEDPDMRVTSTTIRGSTRLLTSILLALSVLLLAIAWYGSSPAKAEDGTSGETQGLGQLSGLLPRSNLVLESALQDGRQRVAGLSAQVKNWLPGVEALDQQQVDPRLEELAGR